MMLVRYPKIPKAITASTTPPMVLMWERSRTYSKTLLKNGYDYTIVFPDKGVNWTIFFKCQVLNSLGEM